MARNLRLNDTGGDVAELQQRLNQILNSRQMCIAVNCAFDAATQRAVRSFQTIYHVRGEDGWVGPRTRAAMGTRVLLAQRRDPRNNQCTEPPPNACFQVYTTAIQVGAGAQNPSPGGSSNIHAASVTVTPTWRVGPFWGPRNQAARLELGAGFGAALSSSSVPTDARWTLSPLILSAALVDPVALRRWAHPNLAHWQLFAQVGLGVNGIPSTPTSFDWAVTHVVLQIVGGGQLSFDLNDSVSFFAQIFGGAQYDFMGGSSPLTGLLGGTVGLSYTTGGPQRPWPANFR